MRRSRVRQKRRGRDIKLTIAGVVVLVALVLGAAKYYASRGPELDKVTLCPTTGPVGHLVLLVDRTDPFNFTQKQAFLERINELVRSDAKPGELLSVFVFGENYKDTPTPVFELCHPGDGTGLNPFTHTPELLYARFQKRFKEPMLSLAEALTNMAPARASPILEMLQMVAVNGFRKHDVRGSRRLIMVSDMLHNTSELSLYQTPDIDFPRFSSTSYAKKVQTNFAGVDIELDYLLNRPELQTRRQLKFWEELFSAYGARITKVRPLEG